jgi:hypothetical protein
VSCFGSIWNSFSGSTPHSRGWHGAGSHVRRTTGGASATASNRRSKRRRVRGATGSMQHPPRGSRQSRATSSPMTLASGSGYHGTTFDVQPPSARRPKRLRRCCCAIQVHGTLCWRRSPRVNRRGGGGGCDGHHDRARRSQTWHRHRHGSAARQPARKGRPNAAAPVPPSACSARRTRSPILATRSRMLLLASSSGGSELSYAPEVTRHRRVDDLSRLPVVISPRRWPWAGLPGVVVPAPRATRGG